MTEQVTNTYQEQPFDQVSKSGKRYRVIEQGGKTLHEYESGVIRDPVANKNLAFAPGHEITTETAREMQQLGQSRIQEDMVNGYRKAIAKQQKLEPSEVSDAAVREAYAEAVMEHALRPMLPGSVHAKRLVADVAGWMPKKQVEQQPEGTFTLTITGDVQQLREAMAGKYRKVVEADDSET